MTKPYGRKTKKKVGKILLNPGRDNAFELLRQIPDNQTAGHLFSFFYHREDIVRFRSIAAMGDLVSRIAQKNMEKARIILRRIMWNLNDESGGIGWGSPEAMGEILGQSPELALEFKSILFLYLDPDGNFIEHEMLQRGVLWGIGTYVRKYPQDLEKRTENYVRDFLDSPDPLKRGYSLRILVNAGCPDFQTLPVNISEDKEQIYIFNGWDLVKTRISDISKCFSFA